MAQQPDIDLLIESQIQAQLEDRGGDESAYPDDQATAESKNSEPGPASKQAETPTLQGFFAKMGTTPAESGTNGKKHPTQVTRENLEKALGDLKEVQDAPNTKDGPRHRYLPFVAPAALAAVIVGIMTLLPQTPASLAPELIGSWSTSAGKYADRKLRISQSEIAFEQGTREGFASYPITSITSERDAGGGFTYDITYDNAGVDHRFSFIHQPVGNTITLKNQPQIVWKRSDK